MLVAPTSSTSIDINRVALMDAWSDFLTHDIGSGAASLDTIRTYIVQIKQFLLWCDLLHLDPATVGRKEIKAYRRMLYQERGLKSSTIALKLTAVRRFYDAAIEAGLLMHNPALGIKPPPMKSDPASAISFLEKSEVEELLETVALKLPQGKVAIDNLVKQARDLFLVELMVREGPRTVELHRANLADLVRQGNNLGIKVSSKRSIRIVPLTNSIAELLKNYLAVRKQVGQKLDADSPLLVSVGNRSRGGRLSRSQIRTLVTDYLKQSGLKTKGGRTLSTHSLRHTAGTLAIRAGAELRQVQDLLGHADLRTTAVYVHVGDRWDNNPASLWSD